MKHLLKDKTAPIGVDYVIVSYDSVNDKVIVKEAVPLVEPELTITLEDSYNDTSIIALTAERTATVLGDTVWATNLAEGIAEIKNNTLRFLQHYEGTFKVTATADNASDEKEITVECAEVATAYTYSVSNISSPSVAWSATEATITFDGITTAHYPLKADESVSAPQTQIVTFEQNKPQGDKPMEFTANTEYVDLGLPSGLKWAKCNLGATSETEYGAYFQWGDTNGYATATDKGGTSTARNITDSFSWNDVTVDYTVQQGGASGQGFKWATAPFNNGSSSYNKTYFASVSGTVCPNGVLAEEYDAATAHMGNDWRIPTKEELEELIANTTSVWTIVNGVKGRLLTSKTNGNTLFIPAAGYANNSSMKNVDSYGCVWSSTLFASITYRAWGLNFDSSGQNVNYLYCHCQGCSVRGVCN